MYSAMSRSLYGLDNGASRCHCLARGDAARYAMVPSRSTRDMGQWPSLESDAGDADPRAQARDGPPARLHAAVARAVPRRSESAQERAGTDRHRRAARRKHRRSRAARQAHPRYRRGRGRACRCSAVRVAAFDARLSVSRTGPTSRTTTCSRRASRAPITCTSCRERAASGATTSGSATRCARTSASAPSTSAQDGARQEVLRQSRRLHERQGRIHPPRPVSAYRSGE